MKILKESTVPVPRRGKMILTAAFTVLMAASVAAGMATAPEETEIPVLLANGEVITPPWYITVDGEKIALVDSQETAQEVLENVVSGYDDSENEVLDIEVREETSAEEMQIRNGDDPPDILTADEAEKVLLSGDSGESYRTGGDDRGADQTGACAIHSGVQASVRYVCGPAEGRTGRS